MAFESLPPSGPGSATAGRKVRASWGEQVRLNFDDHEERIIDLEQAHGLSGLDDVTIDSPIGDLDVLAYDTATSKWTNQQLRLDHLEDVVISSPASDGDVLQYDTSTNRWVNAEAPAAVNWRGAWNSGTAYVTDDMVEHNGSSYIATSNSTGDEPGVGSPDPWDLIAQKGDDGGIIGVWRGEWDSGTTYDVGDVVQHNGSSWRLSSEGSPPSSPNDEPGVGSPNDWELVAAKGDNGSAGTLNDLTDVTLTAPADGDLLLYDGSPAQWENVPHTLANVRDVALTSPVTDGDVLTYDSATDKWTNQAASGGAGSVTLIESQTPSGTGTVTFSSLGSYTHLRIVFCGRGTQAAGSTAFDARFNGDTGNNYDRQNVSGSASTASATESLAQSLINQIGAVAASNAPAGAAGSGEILIANYRGTSFYKQGTSVYIFHNSAASGNTVCRTAAFQWRSTSAITSITLTLQSGNFESGSVFSLYGVL